MSSNTSPDPMTFTDRLRILGAPILNPIVSFLARWGILPNSLTIVALLGHVLCAWLLTLGQVSYAGIALLTLAPLDALDGELYKGTG